MSAPQQSPKITYISWAESCSRSDHTARELGGRSFMVYLPQFGSRGSTIVLKYLGQWILTARILRDEAPDVVFVMSPPLVAALPAFWYAWRRRKLVVVDAHTAAFLHPRWRRWQWLQRIMCRRAATTIVHNAHLADVVSRMGARATVVPDVPIVYDTVAPFMRPPGGVVAVICSFNYDEPIGAILEAARSLPDLTFFMTGKPKFHNPEWQRDWPANVMLTGFLDVPAYAGLISGADVVMSLTTRDHTMLRGAYEAIYQGTPVVVSDWPLLREAFPHGAVHVDNSPAQIAGAVRQVCGNPALFRADAGRLREQKRKDWTRTRDAMLRLLSNVRISAPR